MSICVCLYVCIYIYTHIHTYLSLSIYIYIYTYVHICVYIYIYIYICPEYLVSFATLPSPHPRGPWNVSSVCTALLFVLCVFVFCLHAL